MSAPARVRFAPSPTGYLHIGGVRTALFNWLWARKTGGAFVLRIEDTDRERSTKENEEIILSAMRWLGLDWDEGPEVGGPHGPYRQMERLDIYRAHVDKLLESGAAYRCFSTKEELDELREAYKKENPKGVWRYPGIWRDHSGPYPDRPHVIRLKAPQQGHVTYDDLVFGEVRTPAESIQDVVLMRSDGVPLYNLGAVVDDVTMGINIVARGRDHMINTPIQILLYQALGAEVPRFAHLPMMLGADGAKLSKRHGAVSVAEYQKQGIPADALLNYLVRFGWSFGDEEVFSRSDLISKFSWEGCSRADGKFDPKKLEAITFEHLKSSDLISDDDYLAGAQPFIEERGLAFDEAVVRAWMPLIRERATSFADIAHHIDYALRDAPELDEKADKKFITTDKVASLPSLAKTLRDVTPFDAAAIEAAVVAWMDKEQLTMKQFAQPARVALSGRTASPGLYEVMERLGREKTIARLEAAVARAAAKESEAGA